MDTKRKGSMHTRTCLLPGHGCTTGDGRRPPGADDVRERCHHDGELVLRISRRCCLRRRLTDDLWHAMVVTSWSPRRRRRKRRRRWASLLATISRSRRRASASAAARMIHACCLVSCHPPCARVATRRKDKFRSMDMCGSVLGLVAAYLWWWTREERLAEL
jgi:hypothetical protein